MKGRDVAPCVENSGGGSQQTGRSPIIPAPHRVVVLAVGPEVLHHVADALRQHRHLAAAQARRCVAVQRRRRCKYFLWQTTPPVSPSPRQSTQAQRPLLAPHLHLRRPRVAGEALEALYHLLLASGEQLLAVH